MWMTSRWTTVLSRTSKLKLREVLASSQVGKSDKIETVAILSLYCVGTQLIYLSNNKVKWEM